MSSIAFNNGLIVSQNAQREVFKGSILIEGNKIEYVGKEPQEGDETMDANRFMIMPGLINTHSHVAMSHLKGRLDDIDLMELLEKTGKLDSLRTPDGIYNSSVLGIMEMINSGITSFADLFYSEDLTAKACNDMGIRANLAWNTLDPEITTQKGNPLSNAEHFISHFKKDRLVTPSIGIQGVYAASEETISGALKIADSLKTITHMHLSETRKEVYDFVKKNNKRPVEYLAEKGFLRNNLLAAHGVWLTLREIRLLGKAGVNVSWNSISNAKLATGGLPPIPEMISNGVSISMGTDSSATNNSLDLFQLMKFSSISMKNSRWDATVLPAQTILDMATINGALAIGNEGIGSIEKGKLADIILIDTRSPNMYPTTPDNAVNNIVFSANPNNVGFVIVDGKFLKRDNMLTTEIEMPVENFE